MHVRLISGLASGALEADQGKQLATCLMHGFALQVDVAADAVEDFDGRPGTLSMSRNEVQRLGGRALPADGRAQLPQ